jgi:hypothetical protein
MSKRARFALALVLLAAGVAVATTVSTVVGIVVVVVGAAVMPWFPGMGAGIGSD